MVTITMDKNKLGRGRRKVPWVWCYLIGVVRNGPIDQEQFERKPVGSKIWRYGWDGEKGFQVEGTATAKALGRRALYFSEKCWESHGTSHQWIAGISAPNRLFISWHDVMVCQQRVLERHCRKERALFLFWCALSRLPQPALLLRF